MSGVEESLLVSLQHGREFWPRSQSRAISSLKKVESSYCLSNTSRAELDTGLNASGEPGC